MKFSLIFFLLIISFSGSYSQNDVLIIQTTDTFSIYHVVLNKEISNENQKIYMYSDFPEVQAKISNYSNGKLSGIEKTFYPSGKKYQTLVYADDKLWGEFKQYSEDGTQVVRGNFINNTEHGLWIDNLNGCTGRYKNGQKQGRWRCNEGSVPFTLYVYRKGKILRTKNSKQ